MTLSIALVATYFMINFAIIVWLAREETHGRAISSALIRLSRILRYGPPLVGLLYLVTIAGDWPFVLFVGAFVAGAFWLLDSLLNYPPPPSPNAKTRSIDRCPGRSKPRPLERSMAG